MKSQMTGDLAIDALLLAVWRRKPKHEVMVHSIQGSQYSSSDWRSFLKANHLVASMSRRGNCHDNAVAESFFQLLKRERIKRKIYTTQRDVLQRKTPLYVLDLLAFSTLRDAFIERTSIVTKKSARTET